MVARHHDDADPGVVATSDSIGDLGSRWVEQCDDAEQAEVTLDPLTSVRHVSRRQHPPSNSEHAQATAGARLDDAGRLGRPRGVERALAPGWPEHSSAAPKDLFGSPFGVHHELVPDGVDARHELERGIEVEDALADVLPVVDGDVSTEACGGEQEGDLGGIARGFGRSGGIHVGTVAGRDRLGQRDQRGVGARVDRGVPVAGRIEVEGAGRRPDARDPHAVHRQRAGLVGADRRGRTERLHGAESLDEGAASSEDTDPHGQRQRDRGEQALRHVGDQEADGEDGGVRERQARGQRTERQEGDADGQRDRRDQPRDPSHLVL